MKRDPNYKWGVYVAKDELQELLDACKDLIANYGGHEGSCTVNEEGRCGLHIEAMEMRETRADLVLQSFSKILEERKLLSGEVDAEENNVG